ncbi:hypothetical protein [Actinomadura montaniterrae]|uniref:hypothetical protein n=1 Tax=Actinomadura montaniterrae TaxID=1803903 RepID=UPI00178C1DDB|nr:hypothetical protein [Actinomadura montaniterrae]
MSIFYSRNLWPLSRSNPREKVVSSSLVNAIHLVEQLFWAFSLDQDRRSVASHRPVMAGRVPIPAQPVFPSLLEVPDDVLRDLPGRQGAVALCSGVQCGHSTIQDIFVLFERSRRTP